MSETKENYSDTLDNHVDMCSFIVDSMLSSSAIFSAKTKPVVLTEDHKKELIEIWEGEECQGPPLQQRI